MMQTKTTSPRTTAEESEAAIHLLTIISGQLKQQRRHFDDAVVIHCIRLINDYTEEKSGQDPTGETGEMGSNGRRP